MKDTLTKENFWDEMEQKYPKAMAHFNEWVDQYKENNYWHILFNGGMYATDHSLTEGTTKGFIKSPKYHELPIAMQFGIFLQFCSNWAETEALIVGNTELTQPKFDIGVKDSINHLLYLMEEYYGSIRKLG